MSRSGSRSRRRRQPQPVPQPQGDGPKGGVPHFEPAPSPTGTISDELVWIPEGDECESLWMDVIIHPRLGIPCVGISLGTTAYALVPLNQAAPMLYRTLQNCQAAMQMAQATAPLVGPDGRPLGSTG